ncbi:alanine racemase [Campylobacter sputorum subsp. bubulus]|uniref:Alanine racemase n=1 Tax=Campylobacter sputorum subsp. sputorum TaxID=32024 RepID=A0A381DID2_9BACT|nr:alanine racemase [Campylobacter sputorum]ASM35477.1 alanine racemase [Campylobacter sputorum aubsp. sputorum RM3237]ASM37178.1 alanine racemase [Campylobacter sputorum bv. faecalis CCUG 20703]ASM38844.1 alanine racemase [Campylobacter sputorum bv. paraureolyticus LMG 11764]KAB0582786.1 alanine racemase [Campylobacter sputorum subsp. sputorum]MDY6120503.1 alanine racemase [Campylobacter sputorum]
MSEILINLNNLKHNVSQISTKIGSVRKIIAVLKDNAYGHGLVLMAKELANLGVRYACVRSIDEANDIKEFFDDILVLSHIPNGNENIDFTYAINDLSALEIIKENSKIHFAIDTLMHRNGILQKDFELACKIAKKRNLKLLGAYTHFRSADEIGSDYFAQKMVYEKSKKSLKAVACKFGYENLVFHSHNSAATNRAEKIDDDFIRVGISLYGYNEFCDTLNLKPILSLWANRVSKRVLKKGCCVGYGAKFCAKEDINIATYDLGYADGLFRYNGNGELFIENGKKLLGKMSMDSFSCEDSGEKICIFKDVTKWANFFNTINYEILVKLSPRIKRKIVTE